MRSKPPTLALALGSEDLTWLQKSWWLVSMILWGSQVHEGFRQKDLQDVLSALTGCHLMTTPSYLSLAYGLTLAKVRGWQRNEDAVSLYRSRVFSSPLQMFSILYLSPRKFFEGADEHPCPYISPAPTPMFLVIEAVLNWSCEWALHLARSNQLILAPAAKLPGHRVLPAKSGVSSKATAVSASTWPHPVTNHSGCAFPHLLLFNLWHGERLKLLAFFFFA